MDLGLNQEQLMFEDALRRYLKESWSVDALRRFMESGQAFDAALWQGLLDLGVPGLMVPQQYGGSGLGMLDAVVAAEQLGAAAAPVPFAGCVVMATLALLQAGSEAQRRQWLPRIALGEARIAVGFATALSGQTGSAEFILEDGRLSGRIDAMFEADAATHLLLYLADGRGALVDASAARIETRASVDATRRISRVVLQAAPAQTLEAVPGDALRAAIRVLDAGRLALAGDTLGASQTMLDRSVAYAKERVQFGRPIGSFQGVKYMCADMVTQLEPCRALAWHAAVGHQTGSAEARVAALQAKAHIGDVAREVSRMAVEVHGGVGFTNLLGMPYWFRRIAFNRQMLGNPERCRHEAAQVQGWVD